MVETRKGPPRLIFFNPASIQDLIVIKHKTIFHKNEMIIVIILFTIFTIDFFLIDLKIKIKLAI